MTAVNTCDISNSFWTSKIVLHYCNIPTYKHNHKLIPSISAPSTHISPSSIYPYITPHVTTHSVTGVNPQQQSQVWSGWHTNSKQQNYTTGHKKWEMYTGFLSMERVKLLLWCAIISSKADSYTDGQEIPSVYWYSMFTVTFTSPCHSISSKIKLHPS